MSCLTKLCLYLQSNWEQWKQEETTRDVIILSAEKWHRLFGHFKENHIAALNLIKIVEYAFCLPGTSAPVETVFSLMNNAWTDDKGLMKESTVKGLMTCKINIGLACEDFYNKIKNKKRLSKKSPSQRNENKLPSKNPPRVCTLEYQRRWGAFRCPG
ncbi:hypothetical protein AVEN_163780-1 [Araneus ventricosus]|uniref:HAT C-terminal dimerisation domain-containing protein n=1 Tax=Araneus ventricosus TaxID=182803 RepID=A0A4Y2KT64_ARAVE|nr:hypothetical protein AVEN_163780-1 [Araneus ventricosus]